ncbi:MAG: hypothetical protein LBU15_04415 [Rickettsiales bacterium]|jgi:hypothetical protein|nr:hypothetical protein [Rickettsiales bacterium]
MKRGRMEEMMECRLETALSMPRKGLGIDLVAECIGPAKSEILRLVENPKNNGLWS